MLILKTREGVEFQIDETDYELVSQSEWHISNELYVCNNRGKLHWILLGDAPEGLEWDHENRDKLDNRRHNLRAVTRSVNMRNRTERADNTSGRTGVYKRTRGYRAIIQMDGKAFHLGNFATFEEAVAAREKAEALLKD